LKINLKPYFPLDSLENYVPWWEVGNIKKEKKKGKAMKWAYLSIEKGSSRTAQHHSNSSKIKKA
jgi:hypothetical protein